VAGGDVGAGVLVVAAVAVAGGVLVGTAAGAVERTGATVHAASSTATASEAVADVGTAGRVFEAAVTTW
jgi:hypothetical protein